jgi:excisionase family DNA binding protein
MNEKRPRQGTVSELGSPAARGSILPTDTDRLLTVDEVAELLHVAPSWVRSSAREGAIPAVRLGRWLRFRRRSVLEWVEGLEQRGRSASPRATR